MRRVVQSIVSAMMFANITSPMRAQTTIIGSGTTETATATIRRIDPAQRFVVLRSTDDGSELGVFAPPELKRLNELKVGDTVTITYYNSIVYQLNRPGASRAPFREEVATKTENAGALPGATFRRQLTERVTVKAVDRKTASVTVTGRGGRTVTRRVEHPTDLDGVKIGDRVDITYTEALLATIASKVNQHR